MDTETFHQHPVSSPDRLSSLIPCKIEIENGLLHLCQLIRTFPGISHQPLVFMGAWLNGTPSIGLYPVPLPLINDRPGLFQRLRIEIDPLIGQDPLYLGID